MQDTGKGRDGAPAGETARALDVAARKWDGMTKPAQRHLDWWNSRRANRYVNYHAFGRRTHDIHAFNDLVASRLKLPADARGVSIGVGIGVKEIDLLKRGVVQHFEMWEISQARVEATRENLRRHGVEDRAEVRLGDGLAQPADGRFQLVHWSNSLHHMLDMRTAVRWSRDALAPGGVMAFNEYVGPDRFQYPDEDLYLVDALFQAMPDSVRQATLASGRPVPDAIRRPGWQAMIDRDPTESAQSSLILPAIRETFAEVETFDMGGVIYQPMLGRFEHFAEDEAGVAWVTACLETDKALSKAGRNYYVAGICRP
jgi:SAM-dependent methyltransferase